MLKRVPTALVLAVALGLMTDLLMLVVFRGEPEIDSIVRWQVFTSAMHLATSVLFVVGLYEVAHRASSAARGAARIAVLCSLLFLVWAVVYPILTIVFDGQMWIFKVYEVGWIASGAFHLILVLALAVAARGFQRAPIAVALAVLSNLATGWIPHLFDDMHRWLWENREAGLVFRLVLSLAWSMGIIWLASLVAGDGVDAVAEPPVAARGFRWITTGLWFRIVIAAVLAVVSVGSLGMTKVMIIGGPLLSIASIAIVALGALAVDRATLGEMPRMRLVVGATALLWWAAAQLVEMGMGRDFNVDALGVWSIMGPLIATAGLAMVGSAISAFARARANDALRESASVRTLLYVVLSASSIGIEMAPSRDGRLMMLFVAAGVGIAALVAFAGLAKQAADVIESGPSLPSARVTSS